MEAEQLIDVLDLVPHPEGGHYVETWRGPDGGDGRATATAIYFLLRRGERSRWHRIDADEIWLFHAGDPLELRVVAGDGQIEAATLGNDPGIGYNAQAIVPAGAWQSAEPLGDFALVSCVVTPGFEFAGFELAPAGWEPA